MEHIVYENIDWKNIPGSGKRKFEVLENAEGGGIRLWNLPKGESFPKHSHKGYECVYLIKGKMDISGSILSSGDFILTYEGEEHQAKVLEDSVILVIIERKNI